MKKKIFTLLVLLVAAVSGAWADAIPAYNLSVEASKHGTGTVKFFVNSMEVTGADEGDMVTMTVTPDAGWIVDKAKVSAITYGNWEAAGARRNVQGDVPILGDVTLTAVETAENTWTFQMPAANVKVKGAYLKSSTLTFDPADKTNLMEVKVGDDKVNVKDSKTVKIEKVEGVIEGTPVKLTANTGYKFRKVEVKKGAAKTITIGDMELTYADGDSWETIVGKNSDKIKTLSGRIVQVAQPAPNTYKYIHVWYTTVKPSDIIDPSKNYQWGTLEVNF